MPMMTVVIILIILQGNPVASHPPRPTLQDSRRNSSEARQPLPRGRRSWRKSVSPSSSGGRYCLPQTLPAYPPPHLPSVLAFPVLPGFGGLTPEGNLLSSSESSRATEVIDSLGLSSHPLPQPPPLQVPAAEPGCPGRI